MSCTVGEENHNSEEESLECLSCVGLYLAPATHTDLQDTSRAHCGIVLNVENLDEVVNPSLSMNERAESECQQTTEDGVTTHPEQCVTIPKI